MNTKVSMHIIENQIKDMITKYSNNDQLLLNIHEIKKSTTSKLNEAMEIKRNTNSARDYSVDMGKSHRSINPGLPCSHRMLSGVKSRLSPEDKWRLSPL